MNQFTGGSGFVLTQKLILIHNYVKISMKTEGVAMKISLKIFGRGQVAKRNIHSRQPALSEISVLSVDTVGSAFQRRDQP